MFPLFISVCLLLICACAHAHVIIQGGVNARVGKLLSAFKKCVWLVRYLALGGGEDKEKENEHFVEYSVDHSPAILHLVRQQSICSVSLFSVFMCRVDIYCSYRFVR